MALRLDPGGHVAGVSAYAKGRISFSAFVSVEDSVDVINVGFVIVMNTILMTSSETGV